ncbi:hypothetical protein FOZ63_023741, partial [Perkinsus olseni]
SQQYTEYLASKYTEIGFPVDVFWLGIEHTNGKMYFTWNETLFPDPKKMSEDIRDKGKEMVTIVDPHIKVSKSYFIYSSGVEEDVFVKEIDRTQRKTILQLLRRTTQSLAGVPTLKIFQADASPG